jgi:hypothetical protein
MPSAEIDKYARDVYMGLPATRGSNRALKSVADIRTGKLITLLDDLRPTDRFVQEK